MSHRERLFIAAVQDVGTTAAEDDMSSTTALYRRITPTPGRGGGGGVGGVMPTHPYSLQKPISPPGLPYCIHVELKIGDLQKTSVRTEKDMSIYFYFLPAA